MKSQPMLRGIIRAGATVGFLADRKQVIDLSTSETDASTYIWRRIFLRAKRSK